MREPEHPIIDEEGESAMPEDDAVQERRVGVYVCHCGLNIAGTVDVEKVAAYAATLPGVVLSRHDRYLCSEPGQNQIKRDIAEHNLTHVVAASCSPRLHEPTFRACVAEAGMNPYLMEMVNLREQCAWVHSHDRGGATTKACDLVRMGVARARLLLPGEETEAPVRKATLVVGGGVAGIQAALDLADSGYPVYLVEKQASIGGIMARLDKTFPTMDCSI
jgi:heterodisulfide reductase subunit A